MTAPNRPAVGLRLGHYLLVGGDRALRIPLGILVSGLASRALGVEDYGLYTTVLVLLTVMAPLGSFGLENLGIAIATRSRSDADYLRSLVPFRLLTGVLAAVLFVVAALAFFSSAAGRLDVSVVAVVGAVLLLRVYELGENLLFTSERLRLLASVRVVAFLSATAMIVLALLGNPDLSLILVLAAAESTLLLGAYAFVFRREIANWLDSARTERVLGDVMDQFRASMPVFASGILVLLLLNADKLLVFRMMGPAESGLYNAAARLVDVLFFIPIVIGTTHAAAFAKAAPGGRLEDNYRDALLTATLVSAAAAGSLIAFAGIIMPLIFGEAFEAAASVLAVLAPCLVAVTWVSLRTKALAALDERTEILRLTLVACAFHFPLLAVASWIGTIEAVAISQTVGWVLAAVVVPLLSPRARRFSPVLALRTPA